MGHNLTPAEEFLRRRRAEMEPPDEFAEDETQDYALEGGGPADSAPDGVPRPGRDEMMSIEDIQYGVTQELEEAQSFSGGKLQEERTRALRLYFGGPLGNERQGRSKVVLSEARDVIEWVMPSLMRIFTSSPETVRYEAREQEDEAGAQQASDYANWVFNEQNDGFMLLYTAIKDALISKTGTFKFWWDESENEQREEYEGLDEMQLAELLGQEGVQPVAHEARQVTIPTIDPATGDVIADAPPVTMEVHDLVIERISKEGRIKIDVIAPEDFRVARDTRALDETCHFCVHRVEMTEGELIAMGYDPELVRSLPQDDSGEFDQEELERETVDDEASYALDQRHRYNRVLHLSECYWRVDWDGDGKVELLKVLVVGDTNGRILDIEEVDHLPFATITPIPVPHRYYGLSLVDLVEDLQSIMSAVIRQYLDNLYLANNNRPIYLEGQVDLDQLMESAPGAPISEKSPGALRWWDVPSVARDALPMLDFLKQVSERRTGITSQFQGLDPNALINKTATGAQAYIGAAAQRVELIARVFAETGVKDLFKGILALALKHQDRATTIRLRNKWITVDPSTWSNRMDTRVTVGLGTGNRDSLIGQLTAVLETQKQLFEGGMGGRLVTEKNVFNSLARLLEAMGFKAVEEFYQDPEDAGPPPEPPPDPDMIKAQNEAQEAAEKLALERMKVEADIQLRQRELELDHELKVAELQLKYGEISLKAKEMDRVAEREEREGLSGNA